MQHAQEVWQCIVHESAVQTFLAMLGIGTKVPVSKNITCTSSSQDKSEKSGFAASGQKDGAKRRSRITKLPEEECDEACRSSKLEEEDAETSRKHSQWMSMFGIKVLPCRTRKPEADLLAEAAQSIAHHCLRDRVTMPADPNNPEVSLQDADSGGRLPPVSCAFRGCTWCATPSPSTDRAMRNEPSLGSIPSGTCPDEARSPTPRTRCSIHWA